MSDLSRYFFGSLPRYFWENDSYKDNEGKGFVQRFTTVAQLEAETIHGDIKNLSQAMSPGEVKDSHLYMLGSIFGDPPTLFLNKAYYRKLLENLPNLLKRKGTLQALKDIFLIMGVTASITDITPTKPKYDLGLKYDEGHKYDQECNPCFIFDIELDDPDGNIPIEPPRISQKIFQELQWIIYYVTPINGTLRDIIYNGQSLLFLLQKDGIPLKTSEEKFLKNKYQ